jgi:hypothetical protein
MYRTIAGLTLVLVAVSPASSEPSPAVADFSLHDFDGAASIVSALRTSDMEVHEEAADLGLVVRGPASPDQAQQPLTAEVRRSIEGIGVIAGMQADRRMMREGPARLVGGLSMAAEHEAGRDAVELRTSLGQNDQWGTIGLEFGPRIERRLPRGMLFIIDGKAEAKSLPSDLRYGSQSLPGQPNDALGLIGLTGRTGLVR